MKGGIPKWCAERGTESIHHAPQSPEASIITWLFRQHDFMLCWWRVCVGGGGGGIETLAPQTVSPIPGAD